MREKTYKYQSDRKTVITTIIHFVIFAVVAAILALMYAGGYFSAWFISLVVALIALMTLSIPRKIIVDDEHLTIICILEMTEIPINEIVSVRKVKDEEKRWFMPIFGSHGFFGYYGYYLDLTDLERVKFYASQWQNLIEITDSFDDRYYISCHEADEFIAQIESYTSNK